MRLSFLITTLSVLFLISVGFFSIFAQEDPFSQLTYPITELENCQNRQACETFCEQEENFEPCLDYAEAHNLMPAEEIEIGRKMLELGQTAGPGGCRSQVDCEAYCDGIEHLEECITFAKQHNLIPAEELEEAEKVLAAVKQGIMPPPCGGKDECDVYCSQPEHIRECIEFARAAGLMPEDELAEAENVIRAIDKGVMPPPCRSEQECDIYCSEPEHLDECLTFAEAAGFISPEEAEMARRTGGKGPGGCRGEEECDAYCQEPANVEECILFALEYDLMPPEEAARARKMMEAGLPLGVGPGGCRGEEECEAYCQEPAHFEECIDFAVKIGEMSPEEAEDARRGMKILEQGTPGGCQSEAECDAYCKEPSHAVECIEFAVEQGFMSRQEADKILQMMEQRPFQEEMPFSEPKSEPEQEQELKPESFFEQVKQFLGQVGAAFGI